MLEVRDLRKSYGDDPVFAGLRFTVAAGEAVAIEGRNGSGKSTLLKCLVGAETQDAGEVLVDGVVRDEASASFRALTASLLDDADYFPDVSVVEHLRLVMAEVQVATVRNQVMLSLRDDFENYSSFKPREFHEKTLGQMLDQVIAWSGALRGLREKLA